MSQSHIPHGCYSVKLAAEKLGIRECNLLKKMRLRGWLYKGIFRRDPLKDMPLTEAIENGFVKKIIRHSHSRNDWDIAITVKGLTELGGKVQTQTYPKPAALTVENAKKTQANNQAATNCAEREKCIRDLEAMGIPMRKAS